MDDKTIEINRQLILDKNILINQILAHILLLAQCAAHMEWMITAMKWREDELRGNNENGLKGGYSDQLLGAIEILEEIKKEVKKYERTIQDTSS